ncbi:MAG: riboflavin biosynthesis protein RibF [Actinobacteria bacterium]|uniref:Bifunctional riboflavin kinase/FMN adenylyltransferase n=1 Tax=freshwater metagenome TaxID=449393 RepID=A0A6J6C7H1_9ZZZZ|nr:riboflavin biosynthesis protein RibF [Actinomycetota bacterium]MTA90019.1 riboflavin biosynthesis protein RibF [Actinomycetota bacterium]
MLRISDSLPAGFADTAVAIGKFDGLHLGHQQLLHELVETSEELGLAACVLTFDRHPNSVLKPSSVPLPLIGTNQREELFESLGVEALRVLHFDHALADLSPDAFVVKHLVPLRARLVLVGEGFRFGAGGRGDVDVLRSLGSSQGFQVREVSNVEVDGHKISTSDIRELLDKGNVEVANILLGRLHATVGEVEHGRKLGRQLGFPTANLSRSSEGYLPADGVYAGYLTCEGIRYPAAHSVGTNDSIEAVPRLLESHVIGRDDLDFYDKVVVCEYVAQVRGWAKYESVEVLKTQIASDIARAKELLAE